MTGRNDQKRKEFNCAALRNFVTHPTQSGVLQGEISRTGYGRSFWERYERRMDQGHADRARFMLEVADLTPAYLGLRLTMGRAACARWKAELDAVHDAHNSLMRLEREIRAEKSRTPETSPAAPRL